MKKIVSLAMLVAAIAATSCNPEEKNTPKEHEFTLSTTTFKEGPQMAWGQGDKVTLFTDDGQVVDLIAKTTGSTATFAATLKKASTYYAITPANAGATLNSGIVPATIAAEQKALKNGFLPENAIAVAQSTTNELKFNNVVGLIKLNLNSDNNIKSVKITAKGEKNLVGSINVKISDATPAIVSGSNAVTLSSDGAVIEKGTYYAVVFPDTYVDGFEVALTDEYGRISVSETEEFLTVAKSGVLDLGQVDATAEFVTPRLKSTPHDLGACGDGETLTATLSGSFKSTSSIKAPSWAKVSVSGSTLTAVVEASDLADEVRYGRISVEGITNEGPASVDILIAQAAKGAKILFDSFTSEKLDENWKGNTSRSNLTMNGDCLTMEGSGEYNNPTATYPIFRMDTPVRQRYQEGGATNQYICYIDIKADGGCGGIHAFNAFGYKEDGTYDFKSKQNYIIFTSATAGSTGGGYYCFNIGGPNAMDEWTKPEGTAITDWIRLEVSNIDRGNDGVGGDWGLKAIWSLEEDENGVLQKKDLLMHGGMWWWNDNPQLGTQYGYFGVFTKDQNPTSYKNFVISYTDKK